MVTWTADKGTGIEVLEIARANTAHIPGHGQQRQLTWPHATYVMFSNDDEPEHVGWETLVFDDEMAIASSEIALRDGRLEWVANCGELLARAVAKAMHRAEKFGATPDMQFAIVRVPQLGLSLLWLENGVCIPVLVPHVRRIVREAMSLSEVAPLVESVLQPPDVVNEP
jgi:hypothetical protein